MTTEWTEADKGAYVRFAEEVRDIRNHLEAVAFARMEVPNSDITRRLNTALDRLAER